MASKTAQRKSLTKVHVKFQYQSCNIMFPHHAHLGKQKRTIWTTNSAKQIVFFLLLVKIKQMFVFYNYQIPFQHYISCYNLFHYNHTIKLQWRPTFTMTDQKLEKEDILLFCYIHKIIFAIKCNYVKRVKFKMAAVF